MKPVKCDVKRCGSPAEVSTPFGARYCRGHRYLAEPQNLSDDELRAGVNEFTQDDPPPYGKERAMSQSVEELAQTVREDLSEAYLNGAFEDDQPYEPKSFAALDALEEIAKAVEQATTKGDA